MFGIWGHEKALEITYYGLHALQHRGQDGAGVVVSDGGTLRAHKSAGLVNDVFKQIDFSDYPGHAALGHLRSGKNNVTAASIDPLLFHSQTESAALALNGEVMNAYELQGQLEDAGSIFQTTSDTEVLAHLMKRSGGVVTPETIKNALGKVTGAYALVILKEDRMYVALDSHGIRPLTIGKLGDAYIVTSETCALDLVGASFEREVKPGELITISDAGMTIERFEMRRSRKLCAMEYVYLSRPDSDLNGVNVHTSRKQMGIELAREAPADADVVTGVPDSSISSAIGYAEASALPYELGVIKNRYIGRTFIKPSQELRDQGVKMKLSPVRGIVRGKRVVLIDDSIVRGTTSGRIVRMIKEAGAAEVHVRIASPPIKHPCYYGIDMSTETELLAARLSHKEMRETIGADSLSFLSADGLKRAIVRERSLNQGICNACMTGEYPIRTGDAISQYGREM